MIAGVSYDFHQMAVAWQSESTLWWRTMSTMVAAGLMVSTLLSQIKAWYLKPFAQ